jgi:hypothetical protein
VEVSREEARQRRGHRGDAAVFGAAWLMLELSVLGFTGACSIYQVCGGS